MMNSAFKMTRAFVLICTLVMSYGVTISCAHKKAIDFSQYSDQQLWQEALKLLEKKKWAQARERLRFLARVYLDSPFREQAYLRIGDTYFHEGTPSMQLAVDAYNEFLRLFPNSPDAPYAMFQIGEIYYRRSPKPQRTQENTEKALEYYKRVVSDYPNSPYAKQARERLRDCYYKLAMHEYLIAKFYYKRGRREAALSRLQFIFDHYPEDSIPPEVFYLMAQALQRFGRLEESLDYIRRLENRYPSSKWAKKAEKIRKELEQQQKKKE